MTHVVTILKLPQILRKMARADMDVRPVDPALELRPEAFDGVHAAAVRRGVLARIVAHGDMVEAKSIETAIAAKFVRGDRRAGQHMGLHKGFHWRAVAARHNLGHNVPAAFQQADNCSLVALVTRPFAFDRTADQGFVDLDNLPHATKRVVAVERPHVFADLMAHAPRRLVSDAKLALDFLGGNTVPRRAEQEHDKEPIAQAGAGAIKGRPGSRIDLMPAILADIGAARGHPVIMRALAAASAIVTVAKAIAHDVFKAAFLGRKGFLKLAKGGGFRFHAHCVAQVTKCRKGIIAVSDQAVFLSRGMRKP